MMARRKKQHGSTPATTTLTGLGVAYVTHTYDHDPAVDSYGREAADSLGVEPDRIFKTLLASVDGALTVAIVPVLAALDLKTLARAAGGRKAVMADPTEAERATGYVVGGISPVGQRKPLPTILDESALAHPTMLVSGGRRGFDIELAPSDLVTATAATIATIARRG